MQWLMLQQDQPEDFVIATGRQFSVREFVEIAASHIGMDIEWRGEGIDEKGYDKASGECIVEVDPRYFRPTEVETLLGDPSNAKTKLGWQPRITFEQMVQEMMAHDLELAKRDELVEREGYQAFKYYE
jgi:GDPmannose 4,6-dehydratase